MAPAAATSSPTTTTVPVVPRAAIQAAAAPMTAAAGRVSNHTPAIRPATPQCTGAAPPLWVVASAGLAIAAGTAMGGWRIIRTLGRRISDIQPAQGFAAETAASAIILSAAHLGFALSTTQVTSGAVLGSAAARRAAPVHWGVAGRMVGVWLLTLPSAAVVGAAAAWVAARGTAGTVLVLVALVAGAGAIYAASRRTPVTAATVNDLPAPQPVVLPAPAAA